MSSTLFKFAPAVVLATCLSFTAQAVGAGAPQRKITESNRTPVKVTDLKTLPTAAVTQINAVIADKNARTPAQKKMASGLIYATRMAAGKDAVPGIKTLQTGVVVDRAGTTVVHVRAKVTPEVITLIRSLGGQISAQYPDMKAIVARMPIANLEALAGDARIRAVRMPYVPVVNRATQPKLSREQLQEKVLNQLMSALAGPNRIAAVSPPMQAAQRPVANATSVPDYRLTIPEGDVRHRARAARLTFGIDGTGLKVGVISDSFDAFGDGYNQDIASGDLPGPGNPNGRTQQIKYAGSGEYEEDDASDEGRAMCQIIHALLPGADIYFASAFIGYYDFANNIRALRGIAPSAAPHGNVPNGGCDIIVDDVGYSQETALRDGATAGVDSPTDIAAIKQAVNDVVANGGLYFSSAANSGNLNDDESGTWEGDFVDGGAATGTLAGAGRAHNWNSGGAADTTNSITASGNYIALEWSDPLGASNNDYDLYALAADGTTLVGASADPQDGDDDPTEALYPGFNANGAAVSTGGQLVVVKATNAAIRFISVDSGRARFQYGTDGQTRGHSTAPGGFNVAATPTHTDGGVAQGPSFPAPFAPSNDVETFSSDGPRRVFFDENNFAYNGLTKANGGGIVRQKPDITGADGAPNSVPGFGRFFGTSAAAPHAAAISGLVKAALKKTGVTNPKMTSIRNLMQNTAIDIEAPGVDRDSGYGILDAFKAVQNSGAPGGAGIDTGAIVATEAANSNMNTFLEPGETVNVGIPLKNVGIATAQNVTTTLSSTTPGVTVLTPNRSYGNIAVGATANPATPFSVALDPSYSCASPIKFKLTVNFAGGAPGVTPQSHFFKVETGKRGFTVSTNLDPTPPPSSPDYTANTLFQTNERLSSGRSTGACGAPNPNTELASPGNRRVDTYTIANNGPARCITVALNPPLDNGQAVNQGNSINVAAYSTYDPANPAGAGSNHLGDIGGHVTSLNGEQTFSFTAPANANYTLVVYERNAGVMDASSNPQFTAYSLTISGQAVCAAYTGSTQQDVTELAPVVINNSAFTAASCSGYATDITINATVKNNSSQTMSNIKFKVSALSSATGAAGNPPYRLKSADEAVSNCDQTKGLVGSIQSLNSPPTLAPNASAPVQFIINAPTTGRYRFSVRTLANLSSPAPRPAGTQSALASVSSPAAPVYAGPMLTALLSPPQTIDLGEIVLE